MAAFSLTYCHILDSSLKNVYSGEPSKGTITRTLSRNNTFSEGDRQSTPSERFRIRQSQYWVRWNSPLPRAPAYRCLSQKDVNRIVERLCSPTRKEAKLRKEITPCARHSRVSKRFEHTTTSQLPTVCSTIRQKIREGCRTGNLPDIRNSCDRFGTRLSQRYAPPRNPHSVESGQLTALNTKHSWSPVETNAPLAHRQCLLFLINKWSGRYIEKFPKTNTIYNTVVISKHRPSIELYCCFLI